MRELNVNEIEQVNGGIGPAGAGFGAFVGAAGYLGNASTSGNFSFGGFAASIFAGAVSGSIGGPISSSAARYLYPRIAFFGGAGSNI